MMKAEVSLYPVEQTHVQSLRGLSLQFLDEHGLDYDSYLGNSSLNTTISGHPDEVWSALRHLFQENKRYGHDIVMVTTLTNWEY